MANLIYVGPTIQSLGFSQNAVFKGGVPTGLLGVYNSNADIQLLTVVYAAAGKTWAQTQTPGTPQHDAYNRLSKAETKDQTGTKPDGGNSEGGSGEIPDPYETPIPSKQKRSDGTIVNPADAYTPEGALKVVLQGGSTGAGGSDDLVATEFFSGSGDMTKNFSVNMKGFVISNDHTSDLNFTIAGLGTIPVLGDPTGNKKGEVFNQRLETFSSVKIVASGPFRAYGLKSPGTIIDVTEPNPVTSLAEVSKTSTSIQLSWIASTSPDVISYEILQGGSVIATVTNTSYTITGLSPQTQYNLSVRAKDASGNVSTSVSLIITTNASNIILPNPVSNMSAGTPTESSITLSWTPSTSPDVIKQEAAYSIDGTNFTIASADITVGVTSFMFTNLAANTVHTLRIVAIDSAGNRSTPVTLQAKTALAITNPVIDASRTLFLENPANLYSVPNPDNYFGGTGDFTLAVTVKVASNGTNAATILVSRWISAGTDNVMKLEFAWNNYIQANLFGMRADGTTNWYPSVSTSPTTYTDHSMYYHIVFEREGTTIKIYVNDVQVQQLFINLTDKVRQSSSLPLVIGEVGKMATFKNVSYYNRALSAAERTQNFNALK
ncbi:fibronectin type III domain-containing protein [Paenibacillus sp. NRS-1760]|uniref:fibronectin type III domain-containing protein n=1 Tax=Paenibacillus sp. NRS-1760 TaxID=3233902 RepID=UPI003D2AD4AD